MPSHIQQPGNDEQWQHYRANKISFNTAGFVSVSAAALIAVLDAIALRQVFPNILIPFAIALTLEFILGAVLITAFTHYFAKTGGAVFFVISFIVAITTVSAPVFYRAEIADMTVKEYQATDKSGVDSLTAMSINSAMFMYREQKDNLNTAQKVELSAIEAKYKKRLYPTGSDNNVKAWIDKVNSGREQQKAKAISAVKLKYSKAIEKTTNRTTSRTDSATTTLSNQRAALLAIDANEEKLRQDKVNRREKALIFITLIFTFIRIVSIAYRCQFIHKTGTARVHIPSQSEFDTHPVGEIIAAFKDRYNASLQGWANSIGNTKQMPGRTIEYDPAKATRFVMPDTAINVVAQDLEDEFPIVSNVMIQPTTQATQPMTQIGFKVKHEVTDTAGNVVAQATQPILTQRHRVDDTAHIDPEEIAKAKKRIRAYWERSHTSKDDQTRKDNVNKFEVEKAYLVARGYQIRTTGAPHYKVSIENEI